MCVSAVECDNDDDDEAADIHKICTDPIQSCSTELYITADIARPGLVLGLRPDLNQKCTPEVN